jgi:hypothetical protein
LLPGHHVILNKKEPEPGNTISQKGTVLDIPDACVIRGIVQETADKRKVDAKVHIDIECPGERSGLSLPPGGPLQG